MSMNPAVELNPRMTSAMNRPMKDMDPLSFAETVMRVIKESPDVTTDKAKELCDLLCWITYRLSAYERAFILMLGDRSAAELEMLFTRRANSLYAIFSKNGMAFNLTEDQILSRLATGLPEQQPDNRFSGHGLEVVSDLNALTETDFEKALSDLKAEFQRVKTLNAAQSEKKQKPSCPYAEEQREDGVFRKVTKEWLTYCSNELQITKSAAIFLALEAFIVDRFGSSTVPDNFNARIVNPESAEPEIALTRTYTERC